MQKLQKIPKKCFKYLIGIDEVGRGPVAGPVAVCASMVTFGETRDESHRVKNIFEGIDQRLPTLRDSKRLTERARNMWFSYLHPTDEITFSLSYASAKDIDRRGVAVCIRSLINKSLKKLQKKTNFDPAEVLILLDGGLKAPEDFINQETIIQGDDKEPIISFASIYAKVCRDKLMVHLSIKLPQYSFDRHKGYGTRAHMNAIKLHGPSDIHRKSFLKSILLAVNELQG